MTSKRWTQAINNNNNNNNNKNTKKHNKEKSLDLKNRWIDQSGQSL